MPNRLIFAVVVWGGLMALMAAGAWGQTPVVPTPDCQIFFHFTASGQTSPTAPNAGFDNRTGGCTTWNVSYARSGFTATTVTLQSAPNNAGVAGTWVTYAGGTLMVGTNPLADAAESFAWVVGYNPWVRVTLAAATGSGIVDGAAYGWRIPSAATSSLADQNVNVAKWGGTATTLGQKTSAASVPVVVASDQSGMNVNLAQVGGTNTLTGGTAGSQGIGGLAAAGATPSGNPVPEGRIDGSGNIIIPEYCTKKAAFNLAAASGNTQLVAVSGSTTIRICHVDFFGDTISAMKLVTGTGTTCTSSADETGTWTGPGSGIFGFAFDWASPLITTAAKTLCLNTAAATTGGGVIIYSQR